MTETEWMTCTDPTPMLKFLQGKASERKLQLFACACCRRIWHLLADERSQRAVEVMERYVDGQACREEITASREVALQGEAGIFAASAAGYAARSCTGVVTGTAHFSARKCAG